jgi:hypothetical protein
MTHRALLCLLAWLPLALQAAPPALPDQNGGSSGLQDYAGQAVLVIVVNGRKLRHVERWERSLRKQLPKLVSLRVADIRDEPRPALDQVAEKIRSRTPAGVNILIDMENQWAAEYELNTDEPCLLLFDSQHEVTAQFRGRANKRRVAEVLEQLTGQFPDPSGAS